MWLENVTQGVVLGFAILICLCFRAFDRTKVELFFLSRESSSLIVTSREYVSPSDANLDRVCRFFVHRLPAT